MMLPRSSLALKALFVALFLWIQGAALYDAAAHGDAPHDHYGVSCDLEHVVAPQVAPLPTSPTLPSPPRTFTISEAPTLDFRPWSRPPGRGPPPRGPPAFNQ
ncbi:hypothetical protein [Henriciella algicola]|uniref:DUF2946 domain-containing protein n=1 Tax=Henriciella algicola TaxID=1608422 RepID=A0A399RK17_9PROT|nr:hypothetical protein [Henriciella algicola]RIJ32016.1 hypothetical protein D1222_07220 [Henriciella algicola]